MAEKPALPAQKHASAQKLPAPMAATKLQLQAMAAEAPAPL